MVMRSPGEAPPLRPRRHGHLGEPQAFQHDPISQLEAREHDADKAPILEELGALPMLQLEGENRLSTKPLFQPPLARLHDMCMRVCCTCSWGRAEFLAEAPTWARRAAFEGGSCCGSCHLVGRKLDASGLVRRKNHRLNIVNTLRVGRHAVDLSVSRLVRRCLPSQRLRADGKALLVGYHIRHAADVVVARPLHWLSPYAAR